MFLFLLGPVIRFIGMSCAWHTLQGMSQSGLKHCVMPSDHVPWTFGDRGSLIDLKGAPRIPSVGSVYLKDYRIMGTLG